MFTRAAHALLVTALSLLTLGLATANPLIVGFSVFPLIAIAVSTTEGPPDVTGAELDLAERVRAGDVVDVQVELEVPGGGLVASHVDLPDEFDLVEGDNTRLLEAEAGQASTSFKVRAAKRGRYEIGPVRAAGVPLTGLRSSPMEEQAPARALEVDPGLIPIRRLQAMRGTAATLAPDEDQARVGLKTTDFRELREYRFGDPPRAVNWKATARMGPATDTPLVNEYEVEGRQAVWFMLDAGEHMSVGTTVENGFELAVAAVSGLALAYIDRGYKVGFYAYNVDESEPFYPDVGQKQFLKIQRRLATMEPGDTEEGPLAAVERCRSWLVSSAPMTVFVTRTEVDTQRLEAAIRRIRAMDPEAKRPVVVIEPEAYHLVPGGEAVQVTSDLLDHLSKPRHQRLRDLGAIVLRWNPEREPLERLLFRGVLEHR